MSLSGSIDNSAGSSLIQGKFSGTGGTVYLAAALSASFPPYKVSSARASSQSKTSGFEAILSGQIGPTELSLNMEGGGTISGRLDQEMDPLACAHVCGGGIWFSGS
jgi:hypothetical protein